MGFTPREVGEMSLWEFAAIWQTYVRANSAPKDQEAKAPSYEEHMAAVEFAATIH